MEFFVFVTNCLLWVLKQANNFCIYLWETYPTVTVIFGCMVLTAFITAQAPYFVERNFYHSAEKFRIQYLLGLNCLFHDGRHATISSIICVCLTVIPLDILAHEGGCLNLAPFGTYTGLAFLAVFLLTSNIFHRIIRTNVTGVTGFTAFLCPFLVIYGFLKGNFWCVILLFLLIRSIFLNYLGYFYKKKHTNDARYARFLTASRRIETMYTIVGLIVAITIFVIQKN